MEVDLDLVKALEQLESKKNCINAEADLTKECESIIELDHRIGLLLNEIRNLRKSIEEQMKFVESICDKLSLSYLILERTSQVFDLCSGLVKLNRLCKRIDKNPVFNTLIGASNGDGCLGIRRSSFMNDNNSEEPAFTGTDELALKMISEVIESFKSVYEPLENLLGEREDLPYVSYANKVRNFEKHQRELMNGRQC